MSPVGLPPKPDDYNIETNIRKMSCMRRLVFGRVISMWKNNWSPSNVAHKMGYYPGRRFARGFCKARMEI